VQIGDYVVLSFNIYEAVEVTLMLTSADMITNVMKEWQLAYQKPYGGTFTRTSVAFWLSCALGIVHLEPFYFALVSTGTLNQLISMLKIDALAHYSAHVVVTTLCLTSMKLAPTTTCAYMTFALSAPMAAMRGVRHLLQKPADHHSLHTVSSDDAICAKTIIPFQNMPEEDQLPGQMIPPDETVSANPPQDAVDQKNNSFPKSS
tara:strand:+ start:792 stop:1403 length:612 start_codon:yes stop_codon:yes gene_type:complete